MKTSTETFEPKLKPPGAGLPLPQRILIKLWLSPVVSRRADPAKVKPGKVDRDLLVEFSEYAPGLMRRIDESMCKPGRDFYSNLRFRHPWFGPITARQWYWLIGSHLSIHYRQLKEIAKGLNHPA